MSDAPPRDLGHALIMAADLCLQQINNPVSKSLFTQHNVELGISGDFLQNVQLTQPHESRVVVQELGGIGLAAHGRGFFPAHDQVGICRFFGFNNLIHELLHITRQNDIPDAECQNFYAEFSGTVLYGDRFKRS